MREVDLLVIGSGPAGQRAAIQGVKLGKSVVIVEKRNVVGGVCANTGTIPSKTFREDRLLTIEPINNRETGDITNRLFTCSAILFTR